MSIEPNSSRGERLRIFVTGATGFIGRVLIENVIINGYDVHGLSRTEEGDAALDALGASVIRGDLTTLDVLRRESAEADIVIHLARIHDLGMDIDEILRIEAAAMDAIGEPLRGTGKPFIITSGSGLAAADPAGGETTEESPIAEGPNPLLRRIHSERHGLGLSAKGIRVSAIRLPPYIYGRGGGRGFVTMLMQMAIKSSESVYIDDGALRTSSVHVDDAVKLYMLAARHAKAGDVFNGAASTLVTQREITEAIGKVLNLPVRPITLKEAEERWGRLPVMFFNRENRASSVKAMQQLGWYPNAIDLVTDITTGGYVPVVKKLLGTV
jgi:nucleoside-diphosphate-sugar epimerase